MSTTSAMRQKEETAIHRERGTCHKLRRGKGHTLKGKSGADYSCHTSLLTAPTLVLFRKSITAPVNRSPNKSRIAKLLGLALLHRTAYPKPFLLLWTPVPPVSFFFASY